MNTGFKQFREKNVVLNMSFVFASLRAFWNWDILESGQTGAAVVVYGILFECVVAPVE